MEDVELRDEILQVVTLMLASVISKENLNALMEPVVFQVRVNSLRIYALIPGADGSENEASNRDIIGGAVNDELLQGTRYVGLVR